MIEKLVLGTVQLGLDYGISNKNGKPSSSESIQILNTAFQNKIDTLDTSEGYDNALELIGLFHHESKERFHINTKFSLTSNGSITQNAQFQLKQMNINKINVFMFHSVSELLNAKQDIFNQLQLLKQNKIIEKVGVSIYTNEEFRSTILNEFIDVIQIPYNILDNNNQKGNLIAEAIKLKKELHVRSVLLQGLIMMPLEEIHVKLEPLKKYLKQINEICDINKIQKQSLALCYALKNKGIKKVIVGVISKNQLIENINLIRAQNIPENIYDEIDKIKVEEPEYLDPLNWLKWQIPSSSNKWKR